MPDAASEAVFGSASDLKSGHHEKNALMSALLPSTALSQVRGVAVFIAVVSTIFVVPLSIALDLELGEFSFALRIVDTIILMDAILAAFTPVQTSSNEWSFSGREIWRQYSRVWLPLNILTLFPAASFLPQSYSKVHAYCSPDGAIILAVTLSCVDRAGSALLPCAPSRLRPCAA